VQGLGQPRRTRQGTRLDGLRYRDLDAGTLAEAGPNTGSGRYWSGTDTKPIDKVGIWYQEDLVTA